MALVPTNWKSYFLEEDLAKFSQTERLERKK